MTFNNQIEHYKDLINNELKDIYNDGPLLLKEPINYIKLGGKRLRPILSLVVCDIFNYDILMECSICLNTMDNKDNIFILSCNHKFHYKCFLKYSYQIGHLYIDCPLCRETDTGLIDII